MNTVYPIRWRLVYTFGGPIDEKAEGGSIMDRRPGPIKELQLITASGAPIQRVPIPPGCKPIFYRVKSIEQKPGGPLGEIQLDATVFGYGREEGSKVNGNLWMWRGGQAVDCPPEYVGQGAIEMLLAA